MATTTNFGWDTPDDTDLVKDGAAAIRTLGSSIDTSFVDLKGGTTNQVLAKNSGTDLDFKWVTDATGMTNPMTTTGDSIYSSSGSTPARLGIGTTGQVLTVAAGLPSWATPAAPAFNGAGVYLTSAQSIPSGTNTNVLWTAEHFDTNSYHDNVTNNDRLTLPSTGKYLLTVQITWSSNATAGRTINVNKFNSGGGGQIQKITYGNWTTGATAQTMSLTQYWDATATDYITIQVRQDTGSAVDVGAITAGATGCFIQYMGA